MRLSSNSGGLRPLTLSPSPSASKHTFSISLKPVTIPTKGNRKQNCPALLKVHSFQFTNIERSTLASTVIYTSDAQLQFPEVMNSQPTNFQRSLETKASTPKRRKKPGALDGQVESWVPEPVPMAICVTSSATELPSPLSSVGRT